MLKAKRITATSDELFQKVMDLYELSFPAIEKRDRADNEKLLSDERFWLLALLDDEIFVGMAGVWDAEGMLYVEHLCTSPELQLRGKGYGAAALELFKATGKTVVLEIEPPEDELTKRRQQRLRLQSVCPSPPPLPRRRRAAFAQRDVIPSSYGHFNGVFAGAIH